MKACLWATDYSIHSERESHRLKAFLCSCDSRHSRRSSSAEEIILVGADVDVRYTWNESSPLGGNQGGTAKYMILRPFFSEGAEFFLQVILTNCLLRKIECAMVGSRSRENCLASFLNKIIRRKSTAPPDKVKNIQCRKRIL